MNGGQAWLFGITGAIFVLEKFSESRCCNSAATAGYSRCDEVAAGTKSPTKHFDKVMEIVKGHMDSSSNMPPPPAKSEEMVAGGSLEAESHGKPEKRPLLGHKS